MEEQENKKLSSMEFMVFDVSNYKELEKPPKPVQGIPSRTGKKLWEVWIEGYAATGESRNAYRLVLDGEVDTMWEGNEFTDACKDAIKCLNWENDISKPYHNYYDPVRNTYWACRFYDNEQDARKSFG